MAARGQTLAIPTCHGYQASNTWSILFFSQRWIWWIWYYKTTRPDFCYSWLWTGRNNENYPWIAINSWLADGVRLVLWDRHQNGSSNIHRSCQPWFVSPLDLQEFPFLGLPHPNEPLPLGLGCQSSAPWIAWTWVHYEPRNFKWKHVESRITKMAIFPAPNIPSLGVGTRQFPKTLQINQSQEVFGISCAACEIWSASPQSP